MTVICQPYLDVTSLGMASPDVLQIVPIKHGDHRGFFSEVYNRTEFEKLGVGADFIQDNQSLSSQPGTIRGLHFQIPPVAQTKLMRVLRGAVFDVAVDIRAGSPTYGRHVTTVLSAEAWNQLLIPVGFAHGFATLEAETEVLYKVDAPYSRDHDMGLLWSDPSLEITWPVSPEHAVVSERDKAHPVLADLPAYFDYGCRHP